MKDRHLVARLNSWNREIEDNIDNIYTQLKKSVGVEQAVLFTLQLEVHNDAFQEYAIAIQSDVIADKTQARRDLIKIQEELFQFFEEWNLVIDQSNVHLVLEAVTEQLTKSMDQYALGQYTEAYRTISQAYRQASLFGEQLADALAAKHNEQYTGDVYTSASDYRLRMAREFGEHAFFVNVAMTNKLRETLAEDKFTAAQLVLQDNSNDLADTLAYAYGIDQAAQWERLWETHITYMVDYAKALNTDDTSAVSQAYDDFRVAHEEIAQFLRNLNSGLNVELFLDLQTSHAYKTALAASYFSTNKYAEGYDSLREAYVNAFETGFSTAKATTEQLPHKFGMITLDLDTQVLNVGSTDYLIDEDSIIESGRTYLPMNEAALALNSKVEWDSDNEMLQMTTEDGILTVRNEDQVTYGGNTLALENGLIVEGQEVKLPLRAIAELVGWTVIYDKENHQVFLAQ